MATSPVSQSTKLRKRPSADGLPELSGASAQRRRICITGALPDAVWEGSAGQVEPGGCAMMPSKNANHTLFIPTPRVAATPVEQSPNQASLPLGAQRESEQTVPGVLDKAAATGAIDHHEGGRASVAVRRAECGVSLRLNASARNCARQRSVIRMSLNRPTSRSTTPGPVRTRCLRLPTSASVPVRRDAGTKAGLSYHCPRFRAW